MRQMERLSYDNLRILFLNDEATEAESKKRCINEGKTAALSVDTKGIKRKLTNPKASEQVDGEIKKIICFLSEKPNNRSSECTSKSHYLL